MKIPAFHETEIAHFQCNRIDNFCRLQIKISSLAAIFFGALCLCFAHVKSAHTSRLSFNAFLACSIYASMTSLIYFYTVRRKNEHDQKAIQELDLPSIYKIDLIETKTKFFESYARLIEVQLQEKECVADKAISFDPFFSFEHSMKKPEEITLSQDELLTLNADIQQLINQTKAAIQDAGEDAKEFSCSITLELMEYPVITNCGHTFEQKAIENVRLHDNLCPLDRQPIVSLTPNLALKNTIEKWKKTDPVPTLSDFKDWRDYEEIPEALGKIEKKEKAFVAYLFLAHYQLMDKKWRNALQSLKRSQCYGHLTPKIDKLLLKLK